MFSCSVQFFCIIINRLSTILGKVWHLLKTRGHHVGTAGHHRGTPGHVPILMHFRIVFGTSGAALFHHRGDQAKKLREITDPRKGLEKGTPQEGAGPLKFIVFTHFQLFFQRPGAIKKEQK